MSEDLPARPQLRPVEIQALGDEDGERYFLIQDPAGILAAPLKISQAALLLLSFCDGSHDPQDIARDFEARAGQAISQEQLQQFLQQLDQSGLFFSPQLERLKANLLEEFQAAPWRAAAHAGGAYAEHPDQLKAQLQHLLQKGQPGGRSDGELCGLVAPHIDLHRGGNGYGQTYATLLQREVPELVVILGTGHGADQGRFILCDKGFETPRGQLPIDTDFLSRLEQRLSQSFRRGMLAHRNEHSIEFQALFLSHLFADRAPVSLVPILCTSFDDCMGEGQRPEEIAEVAEFLGALRETYQEESRRTLLIAAADLSHVGRHFGDGFDLDATFLQQVQQRDLAALDGVEAGDPGRFFQAVAEHRNEHRICSVAAIYSVLHTLEAGGADRIVYEQAVQPDGQLAVTYCGMAMYDSSVPGLKRVAPSAAP